MPVSISRVTIVRWIEGGCSGDSLGYDPAPFALVALVVLAGGADRFPPPLPFPADDAARFAFFPRAPFEPTEAFSARPSPVTACDVLPDFSEDAFVSKKR